MMIMKKASFNNRPIIPSNSIKTSDFDSETQSDMITIEELRSCRGFEKINDDEGDRMIKSLCHLSLITFDIINK